MPPFVCKLHEMTHPCSDIAFKNINLGLQCQERDIFYIQLCLQLWQLGFAVATNCLWPSSCNCTFMTSNAKSAFCCRKLLTSPSCLGMFVSKTQRYSRPSATFPSTTSRYYRVSIVDAINSCKSLPLSFGYEATSRM